MSGKTIRIFLADGMPSGILLAEISTGPAIANKRLRDAQRTPSRLPSGAPATLQVTGVGRERKMRFQGASVKEQGITFGVAIVKRHVLGNKAERERLRRSFAPAFGGVPIVLMAQNSRGVPTYQGRSDIVRFLANVPLEAIPWMECTLS